MNEQEHQRLRVNLGAYVLDQLSPDEVTELERHLDGCAGCTAELVELTPLAHALDGLRRHPHTEDHVVPPAELGDRVVAAVGRQARRERRRSWARAATLVGVAAAALVAVALGTRALTEDPTVPLEAVEVQVEDPAVHATADLVDHTWGVEVKLTATGFDRGSRYRATVLGMDGKRYPAGGFVGTGTREMDCNLNSSVLRDRAAGFEIRDGNGSLVVSSAFG